MVKEEREEVNGAWRIRSENNNSAEKANGANNVVVIKPVMV